MAKTKKLCALKYLSNLDQLEKYNAGNYLKSLRVSDLSIKILFNGNFEQIKDILKRVLICYSLSHNQTPYIKMGMAKLKSLNASELKESTTIKNSTNKDKKKFANLIVNITHEETIINVLYTNLNKQNELIIANTESSLPLTSFEVKRLSSAKNCLTYYVNKRFFLNDYRYFYDSLNLFNSDKYIKYKLGMNINCKLKKIAQLNLVAHSIMPLWIWTNV
jgi:hypothetical protein